jgi:hypothetical protein
MGFGAEYVLLFQILNFTPNVRKHIRRNVSDAAVVDVCTNTVLLLLLIY